jgi:hypothetical protein
MGFLCPPVPILRTEWRPVTLHVMGLSRIPNGERLQFIVSVLFKCRLYAEEHIHINVIL